ncbi:outer membrane protein assembly factor BamE domain-containing protein [Ideonella sp. YS5]|uniref:outer membrane protein assembly factor BamE domain-containing protein n=1 Tax=Ideonella sp. YS5 TaxID=3453714 RepID=UPI003EEBB085
MRSLSQPLLPGVILGAGLMLSTVVAHAAMGYEVTPAQERQVHEGMTTSEVRQTLGHAERSIHYLHDPGATWTYQVTRGPGANQTLFDVKFNADGTVASATERFAEAD